MSAYRKTLLNLVVTLCVSFSIWVPPVAAQDASGSVTTATAGAVKAAGSAFLRGGLALQVAASGISTPVPLAVQPVTPVTAVAEATPGSSQNADAFTVDSGLSPSTARGVLPPAGTSLVEQIKAEARAAAANVPMPVGEFLDAASNFGPVKLVADNPVATSVVLGTLSVGLAVLSLPAVPVALAAADIPILSYAAATTFGDGSLVYGSVVISGLVGEAGDAAEWVSGDISDRDFGLKTLKNSLGVVFLGGTREVVLGEAATATGKLVLGRAEPIESIATITAKKWAPALAADVSKLFPSLYNIPYVGVIGTGDVLNVASTFVQSSLETAVVVGEEGLKRSGASTPGRGSNNPMGALNTGFGCSIGTGGTCSTIGPFAPGGRYKSGAQAPEPQPGIAQGLGMSRGGNAGIRGDVVYPQDVAGTLDGKPAPGAGDLAPVATGTRPQTFGAMQPSFGIATATPDQVDQGTHFNLNDNPAVGGGGPLNGPSGLPPATNSGADAGIAGAGTDPATQAGPAGPTAMKQAALTPPSQSQIGDETSSPIAGGGGQQAGGAGITPGVTDQKQLKPWTGFQTPQIQAGQFFDVGYDFQNWGYHSWFDVGTPKYGNLRHLPPDSVNGGPPPSNVLAALQSLTLSKTMPGGSAGGQNFNYPTGFGCSLGNCGGAGFGATQPTFNYTTGFGCNLGSCTTPGSPFAPGGAYYSGSSVPSPGAGVPVGTGYQYNGLNGAFGTSTLNATGTITGTNNFGSVTMTPQQWLQFARSASTPSSNAGVPTLSGGSRTGIYETAPGIGIGQTASQSTNLITGAGSQSGPSSGVNGSSQNSVSSGGVPKNVGTGTVTGAAAGAGSGTVHTPTITGGAVVNNPAKGVEVRSGQYLTGKVNSNQVTTSNVQVSNVHVSTPAIKSVRTPTVHTSPMRVATPTVRTPTVKVPHVKVPTVNVRIPTVTVRVPTVSDVRLKRDIVKLGELANGLHLYRYRYLWSDVIYVGVMAQEVAAIAPTAVVRGADGYLRVDYGQLGLRLTTWDEWANR